MKMKNSFGTKFSGTIDKMTAVNRNGVNFLRKHVIPHNPRSPLQQRNRNHFAEGVETWRSLREVQRRFYNGIAEKTSGYNLFLGKWMEFHTRGEEPTLPLVLAGTPLDGDGGWFILRRGTKPLFECPLTDAFEIALTVEDAPYDFILRLRRTEDVITIENISLLELPASLEGLGLRGQLDISKEASKQMLSHSESAPIPQEHCSVLAPIQIRFRQNASPASLSSHFQPHISHQYERIQQTQTSTFTHRQVINMHCPIAHRWIPRSFRTRFSVA